MGAAHPVRYTEDLDFFFSDVETIFSQRISPLEREDELGRVHSRPGYRLFDDLDRAVIRVLERRLSFSYAAKRRIRWQQQDVGRIKESITDEIHRMGIPYPMRAVLDNVVLLGDADETKHRYLGLTLDAGSEMAEFLTAEHELVINGIEGAFKDFKYPYSRYVPHLTVGRFNRAVPADQRQEAVLDMRKLLPLTVELDPIEFTAKQRL